ncbi:hypothetical protein CMU39_14240 [Elizabethkingia anophelis]|nr:hypothetical protein [Elizabethkingia anophelis]
MNKFTTMLKNLLGLKDLNTKDGKPDLSEEQKTSLENLVGATEMATLIEQVTSELAGVADARTQLQAAQQSLALANTQAEANAQIVTELQNTLATTNQENATLRTQVATLSDQPDTTPVTTLTPDQAVSNLAQFRGQADQVITAVRAVGNQLMGYDGTLWAMDRPWNARAVGGLKASATDFTDAIVVERLNGDLEDFVRQNPTTIANIYNKYFNLPELWLSHTQYGIADRTTTATIVVTEVSQPRKFAWMPKGSAKITPEELRVRPAQIDLQFNYKQLVMIETNWINSFNREGTQAYKMTFIQFLISEYMKKARSEDADVLVRGVYVETPDEYKHPVSYLLRNDGFLKLLFDSRDKKYRSWNIGLPTEANICDYIDGAIQLLDHDIRNKPLQLVMSPYWIKAYKKRDEILRGQNNNYDGYPTNPRDYPNIQFVAVQQLEGSDVMVITTPENVVPLEYKPEEKSMLTFEKLLRDVYAFADYRQGIGLLHIGLETQPDDPQRYLKQAVWSNNTPLFKKDFYVSVYDKGTGIVEVNHNRVKLAEDFTTDITKITGDVGKALFIKGDVSLATEVKVKKNSDLKLTADFNLKNGGILTLIKNADGTYTEVSRTDAPEVESSAIEFNDTVLDYEKGTEFVFTGTAATLAEIKGGSEGNTVRIHGGEDAAHALTIDPVSGKIKVNSQYVLDTNAKYMDLIFIEGQWIELARG